MNAAPDIKKGGSRAPVGRLMMRVQRQTEQRGGSASHAGGPRQAKPHRATLPASGRLLAAVCTTLLNDTLKTRA